MFSFFRNILARALSQYHYLSQFIDSWPLASWDEFCSDPFVLGDLVQQANAAGQRCCSQSAEHQYVHVLPQAHCFTTATNESVSGGDSGAGLGSCAPARAILNRQCFVDSVPVLRDGLRAATCCFQLNR